MITTLTYLFAYFFVCFLFFQLVQKPFFCAYNRGLNTEKWTIKTFVQIITNGYNTDFIACSYLTILPLLLCWIHLHIPFFNLFWALTIYNFLISCLLSLISLSDTLLYKFWQYKLDSSVFSYLRSLKGVFASVSRRYIIFAFITFMLLWALIFLLTNSLLRLIITEEATILPRPLIWHIVSMVVYIALIGVFFLLIRGEKVRPNNPSIAYFSKNVFLNHCALNPLHNLIYSMSVRDNYKGKFHIFSDEECKNKFANLFPTSGVPKVQLLRDPRPNILLIVWESLGARFMKSLGGSPDVAVNMDKLAKKGVLFTRCDAGSFRTDRALVCILSGYLAQPTDSVIRHTRKLPHLPAFPRRLRELGYTTTAVHGGDCYIMHKSDYYLASGHSTILEQKNFSFSQTDTCKWGIHDGYMFNWLYNDIQLKTNEHKPWFTTFQTLSSHEPFVVPYSRLDDEMDNAFAYTDHCLGEFIDKLQNTPAWDNLLIVIVGDHNINNGAPLPRNEYAHIPLLFLGGAICKPMEIDTIMAQTDIAATLLGQMGLSHDEFLFSRDVLADSYTYPFAFHSYVNGFLFRDDTGYTHYDNVAQRAIEGADAQREETAKVILQFLYNDLSSL